MADHTAGLLSDSDLIKRTRDGDKDAYEALWTRHSAAGLALASRLSSHDAEDLVVEAYMKVLQAIRSGHGPQDTFRSYLFAAIRSASATHHKQLSGVVLGLEEVGLAASPVEEQAVSDADSERIGRVFAAMKPRSRQVLWLSQVEGLPTDEIGVRLGLTHTNVTTTVSRAKDEFASLWIQDHVHVMGVGQGTEDAYVLRHTGVYLAGSARPAVQARVEAHLADCEQCAAVVDEARDLAGMFRSGLAPAVLGAAGGIASLMLVEGQAWADEVVTPMPKILAKQFAPRHLGPTWGAAAAAAVVFTVVMVVLNTPAVISEGSASVPLGGNPAAPLTPVAPVGPTPSPVPSPSAAASPKTAPHQPAAPRPAGSPAPVIAQPSAGPAKATPAIVIASVDTGPSDVCEPLVSGTALPGSTIHVGGDGQTVSVTVGADGRWTSPRLTGYTAGRHLLSAISPDGAQTPATAAAAIALPPIISDHTDGTQLVIVFSQAHPGIPVDVFIDGHQVATLAPGADGQATYTTAYTPVANQTIGVRYHPSGCTGPTFTMTTGL